MEHTLTFSDVHKSITSLSSTVLPQFAVLTGRNGSGKTHLLTAIRDGKVRSSIAPDFAAEVRFFDWGTIVPKDNGIFDPWQEQSRFSQWFAHVQNHRQQAFPELQKFVVAQGIPAIHCMNLPAINMLSVERLRELLPEPGAAEDAYQRIADRVRAYGQQVGNQTINHIGDELWRKTAPKIIQSEPTSFAFSSQSEFFNRSDFLWGEVDVFQQAFGRVFTAYRELLHENNTSRSGHQERDQRRGTAPMRSSKRPMANLLGFL